MGWSPDLHPQPPGSLVMLTPGTQAPALRVTAEALLGVGGQHRRGAHHFSGLQTFKGAGKNLDKILEIWLSRSPCRDVFCSCSIKVNYAATPSSGKPQHGAPRGKRLGSKRTGCCLNAWIPVSRECWFSVATIIRGRQVEDVKLNPCWLL